MNIQVKPSQKEKAIATSMTRYLMKMDWALGDGFAGMAQDLFDTCPDFDITNVQDSLFYVDWGKNLVSKHDWVIDDEEKHDGWMDLMAAHRLAVRSFVEKKTTRKRSKK